MRLGFCTALLWQYGEPIRNEGDLFLVDAERTINTLTLLYFFLELQTGDHPQRAERFLAVVRYLTFNGLDSRANVTADRIDSVLEGGGNFTALAERVAIHIEELLVTESLELCLKKGLTLSGDARNA